VSDIKNIPNQSTNDRTSVKSAWYTNSLTRVSTTSYTIINYKKQVEKVNFIPVILVQIQHILL